MVGLDMNGALETAAQAGAMEPPFMHRIRLRAQRRALWIRALGLADLSLTDQGPVILHAEVDRILAGYGHLAQAETSFYAANPSTRQLTKAIQRADLQAYDDPSWLRLAREFALTQQELDLLSLTVAVEIDPMLRRVYGYLHDDATACYPTPWLAAGLFQWPSVQRFTVTSAIVRWRMARPAEGVAHPWSIYAPWAADSHIVAWIVEGQALDPALAGALALLPTGRASSTLCLYPRELTAMRAFVEAIRGVSRAHNGAVVCAQPVEIDLTGPPGSGRRTLAMQLCAALGRPMIVADAGLLLASDTPLAMGFDHAIRALRVARLAQAVLYWHDADQIDAKLWKVWPQECCGDLTIVGAVAPLTPPACDGIVRRSFSVPPLDRAGRIALWTQCAAAPVPELVAERMLTPGEIVNAARVAPAGAEAVTHACRQMLHRTPGELFTPLICPYTWEDIILTPGVRQHLAELEAQARLRWQVYDEWGFGRLCPLGKGITALFAGASGTGKTMAAQVLAAALGMDLYRIDLAGVVNKYIGETEKRLKQVFDVCERANVLLFFDEADALFGQRTQVKDAHDRYANIEIDYLLQRMEHFDGIAILATNRKSDIDPAFLRRVRFVVDFLPPGPAERLALWRLALRPQTPGGEALLEAIDWEFLATKLSMTGADIKSAALSAAFLARAAGTRIGMSHVLDAARREMSKHGVLLRLDEWQE
jgi:AAA+ superfamily predicted ATPase